MVKIRLVLRALLLALLASTVKGVEPSDARYDGSVLKIPFLEFNNQK